jgi:hypothetical protein
MAMEMMAAATPGGEIRWQVGDHRPACASFGFTSLSSFLNLIIKGYAK